MNMKPRISILDRAFAYKPSYETAIADTWRRFGWRPIKRVAQETQTPPRTSAPRSRIWHSERTTNDGGST
jgi:hypothetical protein